MTPEQTFSALQRIARQEGRAVQEVLTLYVLERFLARLVESLYEDSFVLDEKLCKQVVAEIAAAKADDGVVYDAVPTRIEQIRDEEEYSALRVHVKAQLYRAQITVKLDTSTGDPISPHAKLVTMPRILGGEFTLMGHPPETVIPEKAESILQRVATSTRRRDYIDVRSLSRSGSCSAGILRKAIEEVAKHRQVELSAPSASLTGHSEIAQQKWAAWRKKTDVEDITRALRTDQLTEVAAFLDPIFVDAVGQVAAWDPASKTWR